MFNCNFNSSFLNILLIFFFGDNFFVCTSKKDSSRGLIKMLWKEQIPVPNIRTSVKSNMRSSKLIFLSVGRPYWKKTTKFTYKLTSFQSFTLRSGGLSRLTPEGSKYNFTTLLIKILLLLTTASERFWLIFNRFSIADDGPFYAGRPVKLSKIRLWTFKKRAFWCSFTNIRGSGAEVLTCWRGPEFKFLKWYSRSCRRFEGS